MKINLLIYLKHPETMVMTATEKAHEEISHSVSIVGLEYCAVK